jgi:hypothetical protein
MTGLYEPSPKIDSGPNAILRHDRAMAEASDRHRVAVLALPGVPALEFGIAPQIFGPDPHDEVIVRAGGEAGAGRRIHRGQRYDPRRDSRFDRVEDAVSEDTYVSSMANLHSAW